jgi:hypothetical protein
MDTNNERIAFISNNADIILNFSQTFKHHYQIFNFDNIYMILFNGPIRTNLLSLL